MKSLFGTQTLTNYELNKRVFIVYFDNFANIKDSYNHSEIHV